MSSNVSGEMAMSLPLGQEAAFAELFDIFDSQLETLGIQTYSLSMSTLEEVFLRLAEHENDETFSAKADKAQLAPLHTPQLVNSVPNEVCPAELIWLVHIVANGLYIYSYI